MTGEGKGEGEFCAMTINLKEYITDVHNFPINGIVFKDITGLVGDPKAFNEAIKLFAEPYKNKGITKVVGIESRGFFFAPAVAYALGAGFVPVRKPGKLPGKTICKEFMCEYSKNKIEIHENALAKEDKVLLLDDVLATGGTAEAALELTKSFGCKVEAFLFLLELEFLQGRAKLKDVEINCLLKY